VIVASPGATSAMGSVAIFGDVIVSPEGIAATGVVGESNVWGLIVPNQDAGWEQIAA